MSILRYTPNRSMTRLRIFDARCASLELRTCSSWKMNGWPDGLCGITRRVYMCRVEMSGKRNCTLISPLRDVIVENVSVTLLGFVHCRLIAPRTFMDNYTIRTGWWGAFAKCRMPALTCNWMWLHTWWSTNRGTIDKRYYVEKLI